MKTIWVTDIHLEFLDSSGFHRFMRELSASDADAILISGDIAQASTVERYLSKMAEILEIPIYFVLGNHDFYHGSISEVRKAMTSLVEGSPYLNWLNVRGPVILNSTTCLIGHDGWCDGRLGDYFSSTVMLNDFLLISELTGLSQQELLHQLRSLGDEAAEHFRAVLPVALESAAHVVVLTHVPPFRDAAWHDGNYCDSDWLPFFSCKAVGEILLEAMQDHPDKRMTVLCGHTHGGGESQILPNLSVLTGPACYGAPVIQEIFEWG
ncbi:MAG TPA: phosphoesterase [Proteobacteria bacterium]|nr:phosphoesterase [Pseudomonadota bacterium]